MALKKKKEEVPRQGSSLSNTKHRKMFITEKKLIEEIKSRNGNLSAVARFFGVTRSAIHKWVNKNDKVREALLDSRWIGVEDTEDVLLNCCRQGNLIAIKYYLSTTGRLVRPECYGEKDREDQLSAEEYREIVRLWLKQADEADVSGEKPK